MMAYIKGIVTECAPTHEMVEAGGVGYQVFISLNTFSQINGLKELKILTYAHYKEDGQRLYGFFKDEERSLFVHLISVNGVGPNTARLILSSLDASALRNAIITGDDTTFKRVKGIGPKTAQRIIIDLKDKLTKDSVNESGSSFVSTFNLRKEAQSALLALGFGRPQIEQALNRIPGPASEGMSLENLIKEALKNLS